MSAVDIIDGRGYILNVEFGGGKDGVDGKDGRDGVAPDLQIGTVKESEDDQPHVTISDEGDGKLSLNFDLVSGKDGQNGEDGGVFMPSVSQDGIISWIAPEGQQPPQAVSVKGETGATFTPTVSVGGEISWTNDKGLENPNEQNIRGPKGEKGDPFTIYKVYNSKAEMDADYSNPDVPMGAFVCITNSVDQSENATLYVKGTQQYTFITDLSGATGMHGVPGVSIGRVGLMEEQHSPLYKEYGVWSDQTPEVLLGTFNLPVGEDGQQGTDGIGIRSIVQTTTSLDDGGTNVVTVTLEDDRTSTFNIKNGSKGSTGAQGPAGQDGQNGQDGVGIDDITVEQSTFDGQANVVTVHLSDDTTKTFNIYNGHTGATGTAGTLNTNNASSVIPTSESMSGNISLHKISKTGNYNDLLNKPTIPAAANDSLITIQRNGTTINRFTLNQSSPGTVNILVPTTVAELSDSSNYALVSSLATVATSGSYTDLSNRPIIGNAELTIQSADNATPETYTTIGTFHANAASPEAITLSKVARTGKYSDLTEIPQYRGTQDLVFDGVFPSGTNRVYGVLHQNKKFHFDLVGDYTHISSTLNGTTEVINNDLISIAALGPAAYTAIPIPGYQDETYNGYYKIALPLFKKGSVYKLNITQFIAGGNKIPSIGQTFEYYIKYGYGEDFGFWNNQPVISDGNNTVGLTVESDFINNKLTVFSKPVLIPRGVASMYRNLISNGNPFEIVAYSNEVSIKDLSYVTDATLTAGTPNTLDVTKSNDLSYVTVTLSAQEVLTTEQLNNKLSTFNGQASLSEYGMYIIDDGEDSNVYALLFMLPTAKTICGTNISDDSEISNITEYVSSIILSIDADEVVSEDMYHIPTVNP